MSSSVAGGVMPLEDVAAASAKRKRDSIDSDDSHETDFSSIFDPPEPRVDEPSSPLSDVPDDLSDWSEARMDPVLDARTIRRNIRRARALLQRPRPHQPVQPQQRATQHVIQRKRKAPARKVKAIARKKAGSAKSSASAIPNKTLAIVKATPKPKKKVEANERVATPPPTVKATPRPKRKAEAHERVATPPPTVKATPRPKWTVEGKEEFATPPSTVRATTRPKRKVEANGKVATPSPPQTISQQTPSRPPKRSKIVVLKSPKLSQIIVLKPSTPEVARALAPELEELHALAKRLVTPNASSVVESRPEASGKPEVWAEGRQELCETLHYFRSYHGGSYTTGGFAKGFMFDKSAHRRDYMDSTVVISRAGGGLVQDKEAGQHVMSKDQRESSTVASLRNNMRYYNPVVIITGEDNPCMPSKVPSPYCVLDYFKPTHIWWEKTNGKKLLRYRFEKLDPKTSSWWKPRDVEGPVQLGELPPPITQECSSCKVESQQVYLNGWMCLQPTCDEFWKLPDCDAEPPEDRLLYDPRFLKQRTVWPNDEHSYSLKSNIVELSGHAIVGEDRSLACWLGMVCPDCGRCNLRLSWFGWECFNPTCSFKKTPPVTFIPAKALRDPYFPLTAEYSISRDLHMPLVHLSVSFAHNYRINTYTIPGISGFIAHMIANKTVVEEPHGPDDMFEELQRVDIGLRRRSLGTGMMKGESYTRHFTVNYGMPYKFIAATASLPFDGAARAITDTRSRLNWASRVMVKEQHVQFNEVLALGYFEQQKINYHDDGEFGLGPTIATLSLGAPGTMRIRMKARHYNGVSNAGVYDDSPPLPGGIAYTQRLALVDELSKLKASDPKSYRARLKEVPKQLGLTANGKAKDAITLTLGHGDIAIMHGAGIQRYYEHAVEHAGKLRFALTCRYIDAGSLGEGDRPGYVVAPDGGTYDGARLKTAGI